MADWDNRFMQVAELIGSWSPDRSRRVGCVIVGPDRDIVATGFNSFPRGVDESIEERYSRPAKYFWTEHAERNAIYSAAKRGIALAGCTMYVPWFPCVDCARAIVQSGITRIVAHAPDVSDARWGEGFRIGLVLLEEAGVAIEFLDGGTPSDV
jgi:dCMP deaminase